MKEFSIEEKANAYDVALKKAKTLLSKCKCDRDKTTMIYRAEDIESIFPELKEFSDKEIKKWLIGYFQQYKSDGIEKFGNGLKVTDVISWLEKQVELKFKISDWVVFNNTPLSTYQVEKIENGYYILRHTHGGTFRMCILHDEGLRLWTIEDAKDGDILAFNDNTIVIFKDLYNDTTFHSYCHIEDGTFNSDIDELPDWWEAEGFHPATKEQCDTLFTKIKEAGYKWNKNKKVLKRL